MATNRNDPNLGSAESQLLSSLKVGSNQSSEFLAGHGDVTLGQRQVSPGAHQAIDPNQFSLENKDQANYMAVVQQQQQVFHLKLKRVSLLCWTDYISHTFFLLY